MTSNQIAWINAQETRRSNEAKEFETNRANLARERQDYVEYQETVRANKERELENIRHNRATESISLAELNERRDNNFYNRGLKNRELTQSWRQFNMDLNARKMMNIDNNANRTVNSVITAAGKVAGTAMKVYGAE